MSRNRHCRDPKMEANLNCLKNSNQVGVARKARVLGKWSRDEVREEAGTGSHRTLQTSSLSAFPLCEKGSSWEVWI